MRMAGWQRRVNRRPLGIHEASARGAGDPKLAGLKEPSTSLSRVDWSRLPSHTATASREAPRRVLERIGTRRLVNLQT
jgi:hypothetical protein